MAIVAGDEVASHQPNANGAYELRNGDFVFGIALNADIDVLWSNGNLSEAIPGATCLDKINPVAHVNALQVVELTGGTANYRGIIVRSYQRDLNGAGDPTAFFLIRLLTTSQLVEVQTNRVTVIDSM